MGLFFYGREHKGRPRYFTNTKGGRGAAALKRGEESRNRAVGRAERNLAKRNKGGKYEGEPAGIRAAERGR